MLSAYPNPQSTPLSILLFHEAMRRGLTLAEFAAVLGVGVATLRSYLFETKSSDRIRSATIARMAEVLNLPAPIVRQCLLITPVRGRPFGAWLTEKLSGKVSRAALRRDTGISDSALKNYLQGNTTPDPHNAQRIAEVLNIPFGLMAEVIVTAELMAGGMPLAEPPVQSGLLPAPLMTIPQPEPQPRTSADTAHSAEPQGYTEERLLTLFRRLHPQGRRATMHYIAMLLAED